MEYSLSYHRLKFLADLGFSPRRILDIGAYHGTWTEMVGEIFPRAKIFMIEANPDFSEILSNVPESEGYEIALLGDKERKATNYYAASIGESMTGNSRYKEKTIFFKNAIVKKLPLTTLDSICKKRKLTSIDYIKIDTQGSELDILKGAKQILKKKVEFIHLEAQNLEYNKGAPLFPEVIKYMDKIGYTLFDIIELHYLPSGEQFQSDLLFARNESKLLRKGKLIQKADMDIKT